MARRLHHREYDVVVVGAGSAGIAASVSAARNGARTLLIDAGPTIGGELVSGLPLNSCLNARGEWVVGGVVRDLLDRCDRLGGLIPPYFDWRSLWLVCVDPEIVRLAVFQMVAEAGVDLLLSTFAEEVVASGNAISGIVIANKSGRTLVRAGAFVDCTGDGELSVMAGAPYEQGGEDGAYQPVTMMFRMQGVEPEPLLDFVRRDPSVAGLGERPDLLAITKQDCADRLYEQGVPSVFLDGRAAFLRDAMERGELYPCGLLAICPVSTARREVSLNTTRLANLDATRPELLSRALPELIEQAWQCVGFLRRRVPGFEDAVFSGLAPRIGIRETRRIVGLEVLTAEDVLSGRKRPHDGIGKGAHELDVHGAGDNHRREMIRDGGDYDIPFGCLVPRGSANLLVAGRCLSATREAHGSARVMGSCMAMGQAAGTAAVMAARSGAPLETLDIQELRARLGAQGALL